MRKHRRGNVSPQGRPSPWCILHTICVDPSWSLSLAVSTGCSSLCRIFPGIQVGYLAAIEGTSGQDRFLPVVLAPCFGFWKPSTCPSKPRDSHCDHAPGLGESSSCSNAIKSRTLTMDGERRSSASCATRCQQHLDNELLLEGKHRQRVKSLPPSTSDGRQTREVWGNRLS